jgi:hypothetical protein
MLGKSESSNPLSSSNFQFLPRGFFETAPGTDDKQQSILRNLRKKRGTCIISQSRTWHVSRPVRSFLPAKSDIRAQAHSVFVLGAIITLCCPKNTSAAY